MINVKKEAIEKEKVVHFFTEWEKLNELIHHAHEERNGQAQSLMEKGIALYEQFILSTSETEERGIEPKEQYEVLPTNGMERLFFIKSRPGQFACYRQLDELFKESKKRLARLRIKA